MCSVCVCLYMFHLGILNHKHLINYLWLTFQWRHLVNMPRTELSFKDRVVAHREGCQPTFRRMTSWTWYIPAAGRQGQCTGESAPTMKKKKKKCWLACRLAFASFACGRPPPLEASHSLSSTAKLRRQWQFLDGRKAHFHVSTNTMHWSSSCNAV